jgi:hypothetical protein
MLPMRFPWIRTQASWVDVSSIVILVSRELFPLLSLQRYSNDATSTTTTTAAVLRLLPLLQVLYYNKQQHSWAQGIQVFVHFHTREPRQRETTVTIHCFKAPPRKESVFVMLVLPVME